MQNTKIACTGLLFCTVLFYGVKVNSAELLGSLDPEVKKNFNQLLSTNACRGCNLNGAVMNRLNLTEADLEGADLSGARLNAASLVRANLHNAVLRGAWLGGADLTGANLQGADLEGADFSLDGKAAEESIAQQVTVSAQDTVNTVLDDLFAAQNKPTAAKEQKQPEEISVLFAPLEPVVAPQPRQSGDDISEANSSPQTENSRLWNFLFKEKQPARKKSSERVNEIVLEQVPIPQPAGAATTTLAPSPKN